MEKKTVAEYKKMFRFKTIDGNITITGYKGEDTEVVIPEKIGKATVVAIGEGAFSPRHQSAKSYDETENRKQITSVVIPNTVTSIAYSAFDGCIRLNTITIPDSVTYIGKTAFNGCTALNKATIPQGAYIDENAFFDTAYFNDENNWEDSALYLGEFLLYIKKDDDITCINVKEGTVNIAANCMMGGEAIEIIKIPATVRTIGYKTFWGFIQYSPNLKEIEVDQRNAHYISVDGVLYTKDMKTLIKYPPAKEDESFIIPDGVECISRGAFRSCTNLKSVTIPNSVKTLEYCAFEDANRLEKLQLPSTMLTMGEYCFAHCKSLTELIVPCPLYKVGARAFFFCSNLTTVIFKGEIGTVGYDIFSWCQKLEEVIFEQDVQAIGSEVFWECENLRKVYLPANAIDLHPQTFAKASNVTIYAPAKSYAEYYAKTGKIPFKAI